MRIPKEVNVLGYKVNVIKKTKIFYNDERVLGLSYNEKCEIHIDSELGEQRQLEIMIHELTHFIDNMNQGGMTEQQVNNIGIGIASFLLNNKKFLKTLV